MARSLKKKFHARRYRIKEEALARFIKIFNKEIDQKTIQGLYDGYTARFHEYRRRDGQITQF
jgi:hypothetical protein